MELRTDDQYLDSVGIVTLSRSDIKVSCRRREQEGFSSVVLIIKYFKRVNHLFSPFHFAFEIKKLGDLPPIF